MRARFSQGALNGKNELSGQWLGYLLSCLIVHSALGQTNNVRIPTFEWAIEAGSRLNDAGTAIAVDESGNCYVTGSFAGVADFSGTNLTSFGGTDIYVAKYNAVGALQWVRQAGGVVDDVGRAVAVDSSGNCYVVGDFGWSSGGTANFGNTNVVSAGGTDVFVAKYNPNGDVEWARTYGGAGFDRGNGIAVNLQGTVWITGGLGDGNGLAFVVKYNSAGIVQWTQSGGGASSVAVATDKSGNSFVTGGFGGTASFGNITLTNQSGVSAFIVKYDNAGALQWARQTSFTNESALNQVWAKGIATDASGDCYVAGYFGYGAAINFGTLTLTNGGGFDVFLSKYDSAGTPQWAVRVGGSEDDYCTSVATDEAGNCFITGSFFNEATIGTNTLIGTGETFFAARFDGDGTPHWALQAEGTNYTYSGGQGVAVDRWHNCFITGVFGGPTAFGGFKITETGENPGFLDAFVAKLGTNMVPPSIVIQPANQDVIEGNTLELRATASGTTPIEYQWEFNRIAIPTATNSTFKVAESDPSMAGNYSVVACNALGCATSGVATVTVRPFPNLLKFEWVQQAWKTNDAFSFSITDAKTDASGNFYVLGQLTGSAFFGGTLLDARGIGPVFFVAKYDRAGSLKWTIKGSAGAGTSPVGIAVDAAGNFLVTGFAYPWAWATNVNPFVTKYDISGTRQWIKQDGASRAAADSAGNFYLFPWSSESSQAILAKFDSAGARTDLMVVSNSTTVGFNDIALDRLGNIFLFGTFHGTLDLGGAQLISRGSDDVFVAKLNSSGNLLWIQQGGGRGSDYGYRMAIDGAGQVCISGIFGDRFVNTNSIFGNVTLTARGDRDAFVVKYGTEGDVLWARQMTGDFDNSIVNVSADDSGNVFVASAFLDRAVLDSITLRSRGGFDALLAAYDSQGNLLWLRQLGGTMDVAVAGLAADPFGAVYAAGSFNGSVDFGATRAMSQIDYTTGRVMADLFVTKLIPPLRVDIQRQPAQGNNIIFQLTLTGQYRSTYLIETSEDLRNWLPMQVLWNNTGSISFIDQPSVTHVSRFYRAKPAY